MLDTYNDIPDAYGEWAKIEEFTGNFTTDEEIWEIARQSDSRESNLVKQNCYFNGLRREQKTKFYKQDYHFKGKLDWLER